jgi:energy-coupling factor transporter ATP-binding protein EcfA2
VDIFSPSMRMPAPLQYRLLQYRVLSFYLKVWLPSLVHFISVMSSGVVNGRVLVSADDLICRREATVATLWDQLQKHQFVHIRGTPTSGKSTLARLLKDHVEKTSLNTQVYTFSWQQPEVLRKEGINGSLYYQLLNFHTNRPRDADDWLNMGNMLLIIDEAQASYQYGNLWTQYIKPISSDGDCGRRVVLFSSYGSPAEILLKHGPAGSPPMELTTNQRVSIRPLSNNNQKVSLYFTHPEFDDVVTRVCKHSGDNRQPFRPSPELLDFIWEFSNGHPAGTRVVLDTLINSEVSIYSFYYHFYV